MAALSPSVRRLAIWSSVFMGVSLLWGCDGGAKPSYVDARALNCRSAPGMSGEVVRKLKRGEQIAAGVTDGQWSKVDGADCWVATQYLTAQNPARSEAEAEAKTRSGRDAVAGAALASAAKSSSNVRRSEAEDDRPKKKKKKRKKRWRRR